MGAKTLLCDALCPVEEAGGEEGVSVDDFGQSHVGRPWLPTHFAGPLVRELHHLPSERQFRPHVFVTSLAPSTVRCYQMDLRIFSQYLVDTRYSWGGACEEAFGPGAHPAVVQENL